MDHILHAYLDVICLIILLFIFYRMTTALYQTERTRAFSRVVVNVAIVVGLDAIAIMASTTCYPVSIVAMPRFWDGPASPAIRC